MTTRRNFIAIFGALCFWREKKIDTTKPQAVELSAAWSPDAAGITITPKPKLLEVVTICDDAGNVMFIGRVMSIERSMSDGKIISINICERESVQYEFNTYKEHAATGEIPSINNYREYLRRARG